MSLSTRSSRLPHHRDVRMNALVPPAAVRIEEAPMRTLPLFLLALAACRSSGSTPSDAATARVVELQHASAGELADELNQLAAPSRSAGPDVEPAFLLVPDARTNAVIVKCQAPDLEHILDLIRELDREVQAAQPAAH